MWLTSRISVVVPACAASRSWEISFVGHADVDGLGGQGSGARPDAPAHEEPDRTTEDKPEQTGPKRAREGRTAGLEVGGLLDVGLAVTVLYQEDGVADDEVAFGREAGRRGEELCGSEGVAERDRDESLVVGHGHGLPGPLAQYADGPDLPPPSVVVSPWPVAPTGTLLLHRQGGGSLAPMAQPHLSSFVPTAKDSSGWSPQSEVFNRLLQDRIILLGSEIDDAVGNMVIAQLLYLEAQDDTKDIRLYINSPGGVVTSGMAIYDTMELIRPDVATYCMGLAASMGQFLLCAGSPGKRYSLPHARIMMHQPHGGVRGQAADIAIQAEQMAYTRRTMAERIAFHTGQTVEQIEADSDRDRWFTAEEAKTYGQIDHVITKRGESGA